MQILKVTLKQHTPLIHFQYSEEGATLRASEVKPRLDKFLIARLRKRHSDWLSKWKKGETEALNYKLRIQTDEADKLRVKIPSSRNRDGKFEAQFPMVLANMDGKEREEDLKNFSCYKKVTLIFIAEDQALLDQIDAHIDSFLAVTNFGNRQSKGFGSFFRDGKRKSDFEKALSTFFYGVYCKTFSFDLRDYESVKKAFRSLDLAYKRIKSGVGREDSLLHIYGKEHGIEWEKEAIRNKLAGRNVPHNAGYLRAILGTTNSVALPRIHKIITIQSELNSNGEEIVQRFRSPITFKFFDGTVYAIPEEGVEDIMGKKFTFTLKKENSKTELGRMDLTVPQIDFYNFLEEAFDNLGWIYKELE